MAQRRMVSKQVIDTDAFMDMPLSTQALYLHLLIRADDDGFIASPKKIMRMIGCQDDDFKVLITKRFILPFDSGVCVIKHWKIHNLIRSDRYKPTQWIKEKNTLLIDDETKKYVENKGDNDVIPNDNQMSYQRLPQVRLGKDRLGKDNNSEGTSHDNIVSIIDLFKQLEINASASRWYANKTQRGAISRLIKEFGFESVEWVVKLIPKTNKQKYMPTVTTPYQLENKWFQLRDALLKKKQDLQDAKPKVI